MTERVFPAETARLPDVLAFVEEALGDCPMKAAMQISIAVEEIFVNIASYAYPDGAGSMTLGVSAEDGTALIRFTDEGIPFDPLARKDPDITLSADERAVGGLGIYMVRQSMDQTDYRRENGKNIFTITKKTR